MLNTPYDIGKNLAEALHTYRNNNAIFVEEKTYSYEELYTRSNALKNTVLAFCDPMEPFIGILCYRSIHTYAGIIGTLFSKHGYLPFNPANPTDKLHRIFTVSECKTVILGEECADIFAALSDLVSPLTVICPEPGEKIKALQVQNTRHTYIFPEQFPSSDITPEKQIEANDPAYMMFTSGSTGDPKGIIVSHKNLYSYCRYSLDRYRFNESDRVSQMFDTTFDLSVHDIVTTLLSGACLYVVPKKSIMSPGEFIRKHALSVWFSVPSVAMFMDRMKVLQKGSLPSLRYSLFCGEGLPCHTAQQWQAAANNSIVDNLYGPTEATIAFMDYRWNPRGDNPCINGLVSIGKPFTGIEVKLIREGKEVPEGDLGELCVSGDQVVQGYFKNNQLTQEKFISFTDEPEKIWYRTGDLAREIENGNYAFLGRVDDQLQIRGYRVEMSEIDKAIRDAVGHQMAVSVPILSEENKSIAEDVVAFVEANSGQRSETEIIAYCKSVLADYMVPSAVYFIPSMPLNANGKIDKKALLPMIVPLACDQSEEILVENKKLHVRCSVCLKSLEEDKSLNGIGLIRIVNHQGDDDYICHVCLKGF